ncbi:hypothetical protein M8818_004783 [Zalaria obscura]|uniref:Uncharacterized protein n=1 Tax=Zalaria obscura TaxID=2024903 RepID=A0ACC3SB61_9PEZI
MGEATAVSADAPSTSDLEAMDDLQYNDYIEHMRRTEYPMLKDAVYLDHAGTTPYSKRLVDRFSADMMTNLYGNPHSASQSSQRSTQQIDDVRLKLLQYFHADPEDFDVVLVPNATAGIKLVGDALREHGSGFWYGYHKDAHTSLVGLRELAHEKHCFGSDEEVERWLEDVGDIQHGLGLFAYPAQSNMNGRRLPLDWCKKTKAEGSSRRDRLLTLLDAAALVSTSPLDLSDVNSAADFTVLSLYKIFGFPDLGALIIRKDSGWVFQHRKYFGGGTVDMVVSIKEQWHARKNGSLHEQLEDGTLPVHSIIALGSALQVHHGLFGTLDRISRHTAFLAGRLYHGLRSMRHGNHKTVCQIYKDNDSEYGEPASQGPVVAFNLRQSNGAWVSNTEVEKPAYIRNINIRTGGLCNPGGIASSLDLAPWEMKDNFSAGQRCGNEHDIMNGKPTGMIRASLGAMSTLSDVEKFLAFVREFFVDPAPATPSEPLMEADENTSRLRVESLTVYPIKSCAGWQVSRDTSWEVRPEGLAWDREWCIVHQGTGAALSQKRYPRMALIRPMLDFNAGVLHIGTNVHLSNQPQKITVPLSADPRVFSVESIWKAQQASVCGDSITALTYKSTQIADFLTAILDVPCQLARFPPATGSSLSTRHSKAHLSYPGAQTNGVPRPILLSNESPILTISRSSLNKLNETIKLRGGKAASPAVFRANIVVAESGSGCETPYAEDGWQLLRFGPPPSPIATVGDERNRGVELEVLGGCRRCQMVCVDQETAVRDEEPFVTLAKTRRREGRVLFGVHTCLKADVKGTGVGTVRVGDEVVAFARLGSAFPRIQ